MDVEEGEMGDDEAPTTWWVFRSSDFLIYKDNALITYYWGEDVNKEEGDSAYRFLSFVSFMYIT